MMNLELKKKTIEKSKFKDEWKYFSDIVEDEIGLEIIRSIVESLVGMTDNLQITDDELGKKKVQFSEGLFEQVINSLIDLKRISKIYNHLVDFQLLYFLAEDYKKIWHGNIDYNVSMVFIAEKLGFVDSMEIEKIKDTYSYRSLFWESERTHSYTRINAKKDNFAFRIDEKRLIVCTKDNDHFNSYKIDCSDELYQDYETLLELVRDNRSDLIRNKYYQISYKCNNNFSHGNKETLLHQIDDLRQSEVITLKKSIEEYEGLYRNYIYQK